MAQKRVWWAMSQADWDRSEEDWRTKYLAGLDPKEDVRAHARGWHAAVRWARRVMVARVLQAMAREIRATRTYRDGTRRCR